MVTKMVENIRVHFQPMQIRKPSRKQMILFEADIGSALYVFQNVKYSRGEIILCLMSNFSKEQR